MGVIFISDSVLSKKYFPLSKVLKCVDPPTGEVKVLYSYHNQLYDLYPEKSRISYVGKEMNRKYYIEGIFDTRLFRAEEVYKILSRMKVLEVYDSFSHFKKNLTDYYDSCKKECDSIDNFWNIFAK